MYIILKMPLSQLYLGGGSLSNACITHVEFVLCVM